MTTDVVEFLFHGKPVHGRQRQIQEQADPAIQKKKCLAESLAHLLLRSLHRSWIGHAPMSPHTLARPARTVGGEIGRTLVIHDRLRHDGARRIPGTQKKHFVVSSPHACTTQLQQLGPQHGLFSAAGLTPRMNALRTFPSTCGAIVSTSIPCPARNTLASSARWMRVGWTCTCSNPAAVNLPL